MLSIPLTHPQCLAIGFDFDFVCYSRVFYSLRNSVRMHLYRTVNVDLFVYAKRWKEMNEHANKSYILHNSTAYFIAVFQFSHHHTTRCVHGMEYNVLCGALTYFFFSNSSECYIYELLFDVRTSANSGISNLFAEDVKRQREEEKKHKRQDFPSAQNFMYRLYKTYKFTRGFGCILNHSALFWFDSTFIATYTYIIIIMYVYMYSRRYCFDVTWLRAKYTIVCCVGCWF